VRRADGERALARGLLGSVGLWEYLGRGADHQVYS